MAEAVEVRTARDEVKESRRLETQRGEDGDDDADKRAASTEAARGERGKTRSMAKEERRGRLQCGTWWGGWIVERRWDRAVIEREAPGGCCLVERTDSE